MGFRRADHGGWVDHRRRENPEADRVRGLRRGMGSAIKIFMEEGGDLRVLEAIKNIWGRIWHL